ncbi:MAG TPA: hypothetical protein VN081_00890, partial [Dongiaceae bacterium]|nr:hypothetical protein [Dongiaceae bacterium]
DTKKGRAELEKFLHKAGYQSLFVWVQTEPNEARRRALKPYPKGSGLSDSEFREAAAQLEMPQKPEKVVVISGKHTYTTQIKVVLKQLAAKPASQTSKVQPAASSASSISVTQAPPSTPANGRSRGRSIAIR